MDPFDLESVLVGDAYVLREKCHYLTGTGKKGRYSLGTEEKVPILAKHKDQKCPLRGPKSDRTCSPDHRCEQDANRMQVL
jgi:hypothetical protein